MRSEIAELKASRTVLEAVNTKQDVEIQDLKTKLGWWEEQHRLYLVRKYLSSSEKTPIGQNVFLFNEAEALFDQAEDEPEPTIETVTYQRRRKQKGHRDIQLGDLNAQIVSYDVPDCDKFCPECQGPLHQMGNEVRRELKIVPAQVSVVHHQRAVYTCRHCQKNGDPVPVVTALMPRPAFPGSIASPSAVAHIIHQKFVMGLPLYRQQQELSRIGLTLCRQTMANWMIKAAAWLMLIFVRLHAILLQRDILHADETTIQVLNEPGRAPQTDSYMWLYRTGRQMPAIVLFDYQPTRGAIHPQKFLTGFKGYLTTDGYKVYTKIENVVVSGCWSHARRGFAEAIAVMPAAVRKSGKISSGTATGAHTGLNYCNQLFDIERDLRGATAEERFAARNERSKPVLDAMHAWLMDELPRAPSSSLIGKAMAYCLNQWTNLTRFLEDGRLEIDNNRSERSIKPFVIGRKNWLFCNTPNGAKASAILYSIVETAKENGLNPFRYLEYLFHELPGIDPKNSVALDRLLPWSQTLPESIRPRGPNANSG
jgi:transposase